MREYPEVRVAAGQIRQTLVNRRLDEVIVNHDAHAFAFFYGDPALYPGYLKGKTLTGARAVGGMIEIAFEDMRLVLADGANLIYYPANAKMPKKHQLFLGFENGDAAALSISMYGMIWVFPAGEVVNDYHRQALDKPAATSEAFSPEYFESLRSGIVPAKECAKSFLATQQRIPGLGNGVLQDILFRARIHPKRKLSAVSDAEYETLYKCVKDTLTDMEKKGGRDTERDFYGVPGGYKTVLSKLTLGMPCPICGGEIKKTAFLGGSVYTCDNCQK